jgi:hypothetical protein
MLMNDGTMDAIEREDTESWTYGRKRPTTDAWGQTYDKDARDGHEKTGDCYETV